jgi:FkbM family methyltransferase
MTWRKLEQGEFAEAQADTAEPFGTYRPSLVQRGLIALCRHTFLRRGSARRVMTGLILRLGRGKLDTFFRGGAFRIRGGNNLIEYGLLLNPAYNAVEIDFLLAGAGPAANFVDIGSNIGLYTLPLAVAAPAGKTLAIDANPMMIERLRWNGAASKAASLTVVHTAVGDVTGRCDLAIGKDDLAIVAVQEAADGAMPMALLLDVVQAAGLSTIHGLKIDIEGHEDKALVPFFDTAPATLRPKKIVIEHPSMTQDYPGCAAAFERHGYRLVGRTRNNSLYELSR